MKGESNLKEKHFRVQRAENKLLTKTILHMVNFQYFIFLLHGYYERNYYDLE